MWMEIKFIHQRIRLMGACLLVQLLNVVMGRTASVNIIAAHAAVMEV